MMGSSIVRRDTCSHALEKLCSSPVVSLVLEVERVVPLKQRVVEAVVQRALRYAAALRLHCSPEVANEVTVRPDVHSIPAL